MSVIPATFEIRSVPHGEAPLWVRAKWVGLKLPTVLQDGTLFTSHTFGVITAPRGRLREIWALFQGKAKRESGFPVLVLSALQALETSSPEAANWWRQHTAHLVRPGACFMFEASCGRVCEDAL